MVYCFVKNAKPPLLLHNLSLALPSPSEKGGGYRKERGLKRGVRGEREQYQIYINLHNIERGKPGSACAESCAILCTVGDFCKVRNVK